MEKLYKIIICTPLLSNKNEEVNNNYIAINSGEPSADQSYFMCG